MCIVYIAHMDTVVLIVKISFIRFARCVDSKDKHFSFCTPCLRVFFFTFHIYLNIISNKSQRARQYGPEKGIICFLTYATFICKFYIFMSFF